MKTIFFIITLSLLLGCASTYWYSPYKTEREFHQDNAYCLSLSREPGDSILMPLGKVWVESRSKDRYNEDIYNSCMIGKGWTLRKK